MILESCFALMSWPRLQFFTHSCSANKQSKLMLENQGQGNDCLAITLMCITQIVYPVSYIYVSQNNFSLAESNMLIGLVLLVICLVTARRKGINLQEAIKVHFNIFLARNMSFLLYLYAILLCHYFVSLTIIHSINTLSSIFVFMWDYYLFGVTINFKQSIGIIFGITGMILTLNSNQIYLGLDPEFIEESSFQNNHVESSKYSLFFTLFLLVSVIIWAYFASLIKTVKMKDSSQINFHLALLMIILSGINFCIVEVPPKISEIYIGALFFTALPYGCMNILFLISLTLSRNTGILTLFFSVSIIVGYLLSLFRYNQSWNPIAGVGSSLIIVGLALVILFKKSLFAQNITK